MPIRTRDEIARDMLETMATPVYNVTEATAKQFGIERREVAGPIRERATELLERWTGEVDQIVSTTNLWTEWCYATFEYRHPE